MLIVIGFMVRYYYYNIKARQLIYATNGGSGDSEVQSGRRKTFVFRKGVVPMIDTRAENPRDTRAENPRDTRAENPRTPCEPSPLPPPTPTIRSEMIGKQASYDHEMNRRRESEHFHDLSSKDDL